MYHRKLASVRPLLSPPKLLNELSYVSSVQGCDDFCKYKSNQHSHNTTEFVYFGNARLKYQTLTCFGQQVAIFRRDITTSKSKGTTVDTK
jgi:hypothetical protein